jgi:hypothetical protein
MGCRSRDRGERERKNSVKRRKDVLVIESFSSLSDKTPPQRN